MTTLRMDTEDVRHAAGQIERTAGQLYTRSDKLNGIASSLNGAWDGGKSSHYVSRLRQLSKQLQKEATKLQKLAQKTRFEVDEWEDADRTGFQDLVNDHKFSLVYLLPLPISLPFIVKDVVTDLKKKIELRDQYFASGAKEFQNNKAYKGLASDLEKEGLGFRLPDKNRTIIGSSKGKIIDVEFYDDPDADVYGGYNSAIDRFRIDSDPNHIRDPKELADTLGHEMQHAIDDKNGLLNYKFEDLKNAKGDKAKLEAILQREYQKKLDTEARAWARGDAIKANVEYKDDGKITSAEVNRVPKSYLSRWRNLIDDNQYVKGQFTSRVTIKDNQIVVTLAERKK